MGSGDWLKTIIGRKKGRKKLKGLAASDNSNGSKSVTANGAGPRNNGAVTIHTEDVAAIKIQTTFRAYRARKSLRRLKGIVRLHKLGLTKEESTKKQSTSTLNHLHSWSRIQTQIKERRLCMVLEGRLKQKKLENQQKLEAKLHDLEVEWCDGSETLEEILARIHMREEASVKRERALAYAFTHQWRPNCSQYQGMNASELGKANWGWSWKERWIAARPWEVRLPSNTTTPKSAKSSTPNKSSKDSGLTSQKSLPVKPTLSNGKGPVKARRLSFPNTEVTNGEKKSKEQKPTGGKQQNVP